VVIKTTADQKPPAGEQTVSKLQKLVSKLGFTAVGVVVGMVLVAGTGAAAVQFTRTTASEHSIDVIQSPSSHDSSAGKEDSSVSGADDTVPEATEPAESSEPTDDNSASRPSSTDNSGQTSSHDVEAGRSPEPGNDKGRDG
jgi:cytoskeletal protein RodZ